MRTLHAIKYVICYNLGFERKNLHSQNEQSHLLPGAIYVADLTR